MPRLFQEGEKDRRTSVVDEIFEEDAEPAGGLLGFLPGLAPSELQRKGAAIKKRVGALRETLDEEHDRNPVFSQLLGKQDYEHIVHERGLDKAGKAWRNFDLLSGCFVVLNGFMIGYEANLRGTSKEVDFCVSNEADASDCTPLNKVFFYCENFFICIFLLELCIRLLHEGGWAISPFVNPWNSFDAVVIAVSMLDNWFVEFNREQVEFDTSFVTLFRILRLARLMRLVRLVRLLRELMLLVTGIANSANLIMWALVILFISVFLGSACLILIDGGMDKLQLLDETPEWCLWNATLCAGEDFVANHCMAPDRPYACPTARFSTIQGAMFTMLRVVIFDDIGKTWQLLLWGPEGKEQPEEWAYHFIILLIIFFFVSVGVMNLIIGVMVATAMDTANADAKFRRNESIIQRYSALLGLRQAVEKDRLAALAKAQGSDFEAGNVVEPEYVMRIRRSPEFAKFFKIAGLSKRDVRNVIDEYQQAAAETTMHMDDLMEGCVQIHTEVSALDVMKVQATMSHVLGEAQHSKRQIMDGIHAVHKKIAQLQQMLGPLENAKSSKGKVREAKLSEENAMSDQLHFAEEDPDVVAEQERLKWTEFAWGKFDSLFGLFVLANAVTIGLEVVLTTEAGMSQTEALTILNYLDTFFLLLFTSELFLRHCLYYQVYKLLDFQQFMFVFPKISTVYHSMNATLAVLLTLPEFLSPKRDPWVMLDVVIVGSGWFDFIMNMMSDGDDGGSSESRLLMLLRIFRLMRLMRLMRILKLFRTLMILVDGMRQSFYILMWSLILLLIFCYIVAIVTLAMVDYPLRAPPSDDSQSGPLYTYFGSVSRCILTFTHVATFEQWGEVAHLLQFHVGPQGTAVILTVLFCCGFAIMSLVIGVMVENAFRIAKQERDSRIKANIKPMRDVLTDNLTDLMEHKKLGLTGKVSFRSTVSSLPSRDTGTQKFIKVVRASYHAVTDFMATTLSGKQAEDETDDPAALDAATRVRRTDMLVDLNDFAKIAREPALMEVMQVAEVPWSKLWQAATRLDIYGTGYVKLSEVIEALTRSRMPAVGLDIVATRCGFKKICRKGRALLEEVDVLKDGLSIVAEDLENTKPAAFLHRELEALRERKKRLEFQRDSELKLRGDGKVSPPKVKDKNENRGSKAGLAKVVEMGTHTLKL